MGSQDIDWENDDIGKHIKTSEDLGNYILFLINDFNANFATWENDTTANYLESALACLYDNDDRNEELNTLYFHLTDNELKLAAFLILLASHDVSAEYVNHSIADFHLKKQYSKGKGFSIYLTKKLRKYHSSKTKLDETITAFLDKMRSLLDDKQDYKSHYNIADDSQIWAFIGNFLLVGKYYE